MKCHSVAALWSPSPPSHHITAAAATPAALFTGAADGTILHWPLLPSPSPRPSSLLCAHAAAITSLCPLPSPSPPCLLASCAAGVLSLFSASLRCLRRRSLPPWAGAPSLVVPLPPSSGSSSARVAILCHAPDDGNRHVSAVVIVDARTLAVLRTSFHGALIAPPKAIAVAVGVEDAVSVVLADVQGRAQVVPVAEGAAVDGDSPRRLSVSSVSSVASAEAVDGSVEAVLLSDDGKVVALVMKNSCLLKCISEGVVLGEVSLPSDLLCKEGESGVKGCLVGGFFLRDGEWGAHDSEDGIVVRSLVLWSKNGGAIVYRVEIGTGSFGCQSVCEIPGIASEQGEVAVTMREALVGTLLPSLAMADIVGFFGLIQSQIWATSSDSPVHVISIKTLIRVVRGAPKALAPYLDKAISYVLHTMDPSNLIMRKACIINSMMALREIARVFPMVALNESMTRLAVGDAIGEIHNATIRVYDIESVTKIRILDASGPPGLPSLLEGSSNTTATILITALSFSPDGEGLVAFSENGLMIRWWSLGNAWWERLSRSLTPVQCTKLIYVPPWEGFSPNSARLSIISSILGHDKHQNSETKTRELDEADNLKLLLHNIDLSYRLQWVGGKTIKLTRHGQELGVTRLWSCWDGMDLPSTSTPLAS
ncbi:hypothetical protein E2562_012875 [Oryza meyeriana var. granulata]|uniref:Uncharacterized protein n=1 Tax=Oryza meyeriana var. granulata TaxID=110450 RepID=A0A6G1CPV5_9ORYZ|nr:hypothetical protein E2562_012875 [Oryza meyeriana var. granulata]